MKITVVIPVYCEGENVDQIYGEVARVFERDLPQHELEVLFCDNASEDDSFERVQRICARDRRVRGVRLSRNFGYQANILTGYANAMGDAVVQIDADGEDPPDLIPEFVKRWEQGCQVVYGIRTVRREPRWLVWQRKLFYRLLRRISSVEIPPDAGDFRLLDRAVVETLCRRFGEHNPYLRGLVSFIGFQQVGIPYERRPRARGRSKFSYLRYLSLAWDGITSFSRVPLKLVSALGFLMSFFALIGILAYLVKFALGLIPVRGFTTLVLLLLLLSGIQLLSLGILGEYLGRIFDEVKARPRAIVARHCGFESEPRSP